MATDDVTAVGDAGSASCVINNDIEIDFSLGDVNARFALALGILGPVVGLSMAMLYEYAIQNSVLLRKRGRFLIVVSAFGCIFQLLWVADVLLLDNRTVGLPCELKVNLFLMAAIFQLVPAALRLLKFFFRVQLTKRLAKLKLANLVAKHNNPNFNQDASINGSKNGSKTSIVQSPNGNERLQSPVGGITSSKQRSKGDSFNVSKSFAGPSSNQSKSSGPALKMPRKAQFFLASDNFGYIAMTVAIVIGIIIAIPEALKVRDCRSPNCSFIDMRIGALESLGFAIVILPIGFILMFMTRNEPDPLQMFNELLLVWINVMVFFIPSVLLSILDPKEIDQSGKFSFSLIWMFGSMTYVMILFGAPMRVARYEWAQTRNRQGPVTLNDVLATETGRNGFKAFLVSEFSIENFLCWNDIRDYKAKFATRSSGFNFRLQQRILDAYVDNDGLLEVNIPGELKEKLTAKISEASDGVAHIDDFDELETEMFNLMENDSFARFLASPFNVANTWDKPLSPKDADVDVTPSGTSL